MLLPKMRTSRDGKLSGYGLKIYPLFDPVEFGPKIHDASAYL